MNETTPTSCDLLVLGSGGAAMTAAYLGAKAGLSTVLLEKTSRLGGTSAYSGGACWLPGSEVQRRAGLADSTDSARAYLQAVLPNADAAKVEAFLGESERLVAELESDPDLAFEWVPFPEYFDAPGRVEFGRSIKPADIARDDLPAEVVELVRPSVERDRAGRSGRGTLTGGQALIGRLLTAYLREGGVVRTRHRVVDYITQQGRVTGVVAATEDGSVRLTARHGVLVASGGFEGDPRLRDEHGVPGSASWTMAPSGTNTGEPIFAAAAVGAATELLDQAWFCPGLEQPDGGGSFTLGFRGGIMVDSHGHRYANECLPYDRFGRAMAEAPERIPSWLIYDSREGGNLPAIAIPEGVPDEHLAEGTRVRAETLAELARAIGVDEHVLVATIERYNGFAAAGRDADFHRGDDEYDTFFASGEGANKALVAVAEPPYYAARFVLSDLGTKGGLVTDAEARVLRSDGTPLAGLYAMGNSAASLTGAVYPAPGLPLATGMVFASLAVADLRKTDVARGTVESTPR